MFFKLATVSLLPLFVFVCSLTSTTFCQTGTGKIIAKGNPALTEGDAKCLMDFYEWAFETDFTPSEHNEFQRILIVDHRKDPQQLRKNIDDIAEAFDRIKKMSDGDARSARTAIIASLIVDLEANRGSEDSELLLAVYHRGVEQYSAMSRPERDTKNRSNAGSNGSIVGKWYRTDGQTQGDGTGKTTYRATEDHTFEFMADGTAKYTMKGDLLVNRCTGTVNNNATGTYTITGNVLNIVLTDGSMVSKHSCDRAENFNRKYPRETIKKSFEIRPVENFMKPEVKFELCVQNEQGETCFDKIG